MPDLRQLLFIVNCNSNNMTVLSEIICVNQRQIEVLHKMDKTLQFVLKTKADSTISLLHFYHIDRSDYIK